MLALDHDSDDDDDDDDDHGGEEERRAWPARTEETAARCVEVDESEFNHFPARRLLIVHSDTNDD